MGGIETDMTFRSKLIPHKILKEHARVALGTVLRGLQEFGAEQLESQARTKKVFCVASQNLFCMPH